MGVQVLTDGGGSKRECQGRVKEHAPEKEILPKSRNKGRLFAVLLGQHVAGKTCHGVFDVK